MALLLLSYPHQDKQSTPGMSVALRRTAAHSGTVRPNRASNRKPHETAAPVVVRAVRPRKQNAPLRREQT